MAPSAVAAPSMQARQAELLKVPRPSLLRNSSKLGTKRKIICFSDFDGTIALGDTGHHMVNKFGCGEERRKVLDEQINSGERTFRDVSDEMWGSLNVPFEDGFEVLREALEPDPDFHAFHQFCVENQIPFNVISAGLKPVLRRVLDHYLGEEAAASIEIVANDVEIPTDGSGWKPVWLHDSDLGHDKAKSITDYREHAKLESEDGTIPLIVFIGDGVSDLPAARQADVLFARRGLRLEEYCVEHRLPYIPFDTFADIEREVTKIAMVDEQKTRGKGLPATFNPRANLWRRVSSRNAVPLFASFTPRDEKMLVWPEIFSQMNVPLTSTPVEAPALAVPAA